VPLAKAEPKEQPYCINATLTRLTAEERGSRPSMILKPNGTDLETGMGKENAMLKMEIELQIMELHYHLVVWDASKE
jgi:hypothetical protein